MLYFLILITAVIQATILNVISIGGAKPDLLLIIVVFAAFYTDGWFSAAKAAIAAGLLKDVLSASAALDTVLFPICGAAVSLFFTKFYFHKERLPARFLAQLLASAFVLFMHIAAFPSGTAGAGAAVSSGIPAVLYTSFAAIPAFSVLTQIPGLRKKYAA